MTAGVAVQDGDHDERRDRRPHDHADPEDRRPMATTASCGLATARAAMAAARRDGRDRRRSLPSGRRAAEPGRGIGARWASRGVGHGASGAPTVAGSASSTGATSGAVAVRPRRGRPPPGRDADPSDRSAVRVAMSTMALSAAALTMQKIGRDRQRPSCDRAAGRATRVRCRPGRRPPAARAPRACTAGRGRRAPGCSRTARCSGTTITRRKSLCHSSWTRVEAGAGAGPSGARISRVPRRPRVMIRTLRPNSSPPERRRRLVGDGVARRRRVAGPGR